jgi:hypothetical protein
MKIVAIRGDEDVDNNYGDDDDDNNCICIVLATMFKL